MILYEKVFFYLHARNVECALFVYLLIFCCYYRSEYAEMNISKLHLRIDELEDEIIRYCIVLLACLLCNVVCTVLLSKMSYYCKFLY